MEAGCGRPSPWSYRLKPLSEGGNRFGDALPPTSGSSNVPGPKRTVVKEQVRAEQ